MRAAQLSNGLATHEINLSQQALTRHSPVQVTGNYIGRNSHERLDIRKRFPPSLRKCMFQKDNSDSSEKQLQEFLFFIDRNFS
jgi:hypothetical protein